MKTLTLVIELKRIVTHGDDAIDIMQSEMPAKKARRAFAYHSEYAHGNFYRNVYLLDGKAVIAGKKY